MSDPETYGCKWLGDVSHAEWGLGNDRADSRMRRFVQTRQHGRKRCALRVDVAAWDARDAYDRALSQAAVLRDRVIAAHRTSSFSLLSDGLICDLSTSELEMFGVDSGAGPHRAHPLVGEDTEELRSSLRYQGLARSEPLPVVATMHSWIALECLAESAPSGSATDLPRRIAALMTLTAVANLWPRSWDIAWQTGRRTTPDRWRELEQWFGVTTNPSYLPDRGRWGRLLVRAHEGGATANTLPDGADLDDAAAVLRGILGGWPPYAARRLSQTAALMASGSRLIDWASRITDRAHANVNRVQLMRHRAVHTALYESPGDKHLALAARQILDAVYEVLPQWMPPGVRAFEGLQEAALYKRYLFRLWKNPALPGRRVPYASDPARITRR